MKLGLGSQIGIAPRWSEPNEASREHRLSEPLE